MMKITLINEDGTDIDDFPKNPLEAKWEKLYPKKEICIILEKSNIMNYGCVNCSKCPEGDLWKIPKEDLEEYKNYLEKVKEYSKIHNPNYAATIEKKLNYKINSEDNI